MYYGQTEFNKLMKRYQKILIKAGMKLPPIIYHYKAKNKLCYSGKFFYYINPRGVTKFKTRYRVKDIMALIEDFKTNPWISWNNE